MDSLPTKPGSYRLVSALRGWARFRTFQARIELQVAMETDASAQAEDVKMPIFKRPVILWLSEPSPGQLVLRLWVLLYRMAD